MKIKSISIVLKGQGEDFKKSQGKPPFPFSMAGKVQILGFKNLFKKNIIDNLSSLTKYSYLYDFIFIKLKFFAYMIY